MGDGKERLTRDSPALIQEVDAFARNYTNWCSIDSDIEIDLMSDKRIEGISTTSEKFNCMKCEPEKAERKPFTWIPK